MPSSTCIFENATVLPVDDGPSPATAVAVRDGRFLALGTGDELRAACSEADVVDAQGRAFVPGLIDAHAHLHEVGHALRQVDLSGAADPDAIVDRLAATAAERDRPSDAWLRGHGWDETEWTGGAEPSRALLDATVPERPVWLTRTDLHAGWANTAALEATVGLDRLRRMDDPDGGRIRRDETGRPTGVLVDRAMALVADHVPEPSGAETDRALRTALRHAVRHGVTGVHDACVRRPQLRRLRRFADDGALPLRVYAMVHGREAVAAAREQGPWRHPSGRLDVRATKLFADGALGSRGAALLADYADAPGERGQLRHRPAELRRRVRRAVESGLQVATHAIGDRANRVVLDAYAAAARECDAPVRRPRLEHAQVLAPDDRPRLAALGGMASVQPTHATSDMGWVEDRLGPDRLTGAYAWKQLHDTGATLAFGSDAPVEPLDPLLGLHAAVTRQTPDGHPEGGWRPAERLSRAAALRAHTLGAATAAFWEDDLGTIAPGKRADWVVLSRDPMTVPAAEIPEIDVVATYVDGEPVYARADWPDP
jgi:predicted amidohydrolase YtcJ